MVVLEGRSTGGGAVVNAGIKMKNGGIDVVLYCIPMGRPTVQQNTTAMPSHFLIRKWLGIAVVFCCTVGRPIGIQYSTTSIPPFFILIPAFTTAPPPVDLPSSTTILYYLSIIS